jgi:transcriptional regulator with XRE-family HTH domain
MNATQKLLERVRATTETGSDYAVAKALGISVQRMSRYMHEVDQLRDDATIARAAELLNDDASALLAEFHAENAKNEKARRAWRRLAILAREHAAAALVLGISAGATMAPSPAQALQFAQGFPPGSPEARLYIMLSHKPVDLR